MSFVYLRPSLKKGPNVLFKEARTVPIVKRGEDRPGMTIRYERYKCSIRDWPAGS